MSETTTLPTTEAPATTPAKARPKAKPTAKAKANKKPAKAAKPAARKATAEASANGRPRKELRKPHLQVLRQLAKAPNGLTRPQVAERAVKAGESLYNGRISGETQTYADLVTKKYVTPKDGEGGTVYTITAAGKKAYEANK